MQRAENPCTVIWKRPPGVIPAAFLSQFPGLGKSPVILGFLASEFPIPGNGGASPDAGVGLRSEPVVSS
jgi:hypothetical protein